MTDADDHAKVEKKAAKAAQKLLKKQAKAEAKAASSGSAAARTASAPSSTPSTSAKHDTLTPAERSAAAAERQVRYTRVRMWIGILTLLATIVTILLTVDPFGWWSR